MGTVMRTNEYVLQTYSIEVDIISASMIYNRGDGYRLANGTHVRSAGQQILCTVVNRLCLRASTICYNMRMPLQIWSDVGPMCVVVQNYIMATLWGRDNCVDWSIKIFESCNPSGQQNSLSVHLPE